MTELKHTAGPWAAKKLSGGYAEPWWVVLWPDKSKPGLHMHRIDWHGQMTEADAKLVAAAPELLVACINARDMLAIDRQAYVDGQQLRDSRTDDPIAHGLVAVEDGVWLDADDAEALRDYDRAIELIDKATAKANGAQE